MRITGTGGTRKQDSLTICQETAITGTPTGGGRLRVGPLGRWQARGVSDLGTGRARVFGAYAEDYERAFTRTARTSPASGEAGQ